MTSTFNCQIINFLVIVFGSVVKNLNLRFSRYRISIITTQFISQVSSWCVIRILH